MQLPLSIDSALSVPRKDFPNTMNNFDPSLWVEPPRSSTPSSALAPSSNELSSCLSSGSPSNLSLREIQNIIANLSLNPPTPVSQRRGYATSPLGSNGAGGLFSDQNSPSSLPQQMQQQRHQQQQQPAISTSPTFGSALLHAANTTNLQMHLQKQLAANNANVNNNNINNLYSNAAFNPLRNLVESSAISTLFNDFRQTPVRNGHANSFSSSNCSSPVENSNPNSNDNRLDNRFGTSFSSNHLPVNMLNYAADILAGQISSSSSSSPPDIMNVDCAAKMYRNAALISEATCTWSGQLPSRTSKNPVYSCKVFVGGVPWDITENTLLSAFKIFGNVRVEWPGREARYAKSLVRPSAKGKGYVYMIFEHEKSVKLLLQNCTHDYNGSGDYYFKLTSRRMRTKEIRQVQIIPWIISDSNYVKCPSQRLDPKKTVFVGALHGMITAEVLANVISDLFGGVVYAGIDTDKYKYPIGSGRVVFNNNRSYYKAVQAAFVEIKTLKFTKKVQIDPYLEDAVCCLCQSQPGPYFCRELMCYRYFCKSCWQSQHALDVMRSHKPLMRNTRRCPAGGLGENCSFFPGAGVFGAASGGGGFFGAPSGTSLNSNSIFPVGHSQHPEPQQSAVAPYYDFNLATCLGYYGVA